jgi:hypothetical protein
VSHHVHTPGSLDRQRAREPGSASSPGWGEE